MIDLYIKAESQHELHAALLAAGFAPGDDDVLYHPSILLDEVGVIYRPTGGQLSGHDGQSYPETAPLPGYHANLRVLDDSLADGFAALALSPAPASPERVWA